MLPRGGGYGIRPYGNNLEDPQNAPAFCLFKIRNLLQILKSSTPKTSARDVFSAQDDTRERAKNGTDVQCTPLLP